MANDSNIESCFFSYPSIEMYVLGSLSTQNMFWFRNKKIIFPLITSPSIYSEKQLQDI